MRIETLIFDRDDRVDQMRRYVRQRDVDALFVEDREGQLVVRVVDDRGFGHVADAPDRVFSGESCARAREQPDATAEHRHGEDGHAHGQACYQPALMLECATPTAMEEGIVEIEPEGHPGPMCATRGPIQSAVSSLQSAVSSHR